MNEDIFREYDIRGIVERDFPDDVVYNIGRAYGTILKGNNQINSSVSGDIRFTTNKLKESLTSGLLDVGINVYDMGVLPTPINYFSLYHTDIKNSIQVTGSHNPKEYNGFKISFNKKPFFGRDIHKLKNIIKNNSYSKLSIKGKYAKIDVLDDYINMIKSNISIKSDINCIMDCGNSVGGLVAPQIFKELGIGVEELYCDINPNFPNHHPDPTVDKNLKDIIAKIKIGKYDLGIAYDGDADRVVAIDEKANIIRPDILMCIFLPYVVSKGETVVYDVKCSKSLEMMIKNNGSIPEMYKTGHSLIKNKMLDTKSKFGGEMSGHIFFADRYYGYDDGIYVSLRLIELLSRSKESLSEHLLNIPTFISTPEIRLDCENDQIKFEIVENVISYFKKRFQCNLIDGVRIEFESGWGLIRSSNTQPVIVCRFEADNQDNLNKIKKLVFDKIQEYGDIKIEF